MFNRYKEKVWYLLGLHVEKCGNKRYRKPWRYEAYSAVAQERLARRLAGIGEIDYKAEIQRILKTTALHTDSAYEGIKLIFSADITEHIKEYDKENLCKYLNIHIEFSNNIVSISSNNARRMAECFLFLLCDFIDLNVIPTDIYCFKSLLLTIDSLLQNSVEYRSDEIKLFVNDINLSQALFHCGFRQNNEKIEIAPYRPEVTIWSNVLSDLIDASISWPYHLQKKDLQPSYFSQFSYVQQSLHSMNFTYYGVLVVDKINNINDIEQQIITAEQARRHIKFPHFMYASVSNTDNKTLPYLVMWSCGNKIDEVAFQSQIEKCSDSLYPGDLHWINNSYIKICKKNSTAVSQMWMSKEHNDMLIQFKLSKLIIGVIFLGGL